MNKKTLALYLSLVALTVLAPIVYCTPAQREKLAVPTLSQIDAIGSTIAQATEWARDHGADEKLALQALQAISDKDPKQAVDILRKMLEALAAKGEPVPPQVVALVQTAEGALAAQAVQDGMRSLSTSPSAMPSSGL